MSALSQDNPPNLKTFGRSASVGGEPVGERMTEESPARVPTTPERKKRNETEEQTPEHIRKAWKLWDDLDKNRHNPAFIEREIEELDRKKRRLEERRKAEANKKAAAKGGGGATKDTFYSNMLAAKMLELRF